MEEILTFVRIVILNLMTLSESGKLHNYLSAKAGTSLNISYPILSDPAKAGTSRALGNIIAEGGRT